MGRNLTYNSVFQNLIFNVLNVPIRVIFQNSVSFIEFNVNRIVQSISYIISTNIIDYNNKIEQLVKFCSNCVMYN